MKKLVYSILCSILILSTLTFIGCEKRDKFSLAEKEKIENLTLPNERENLVDIKLYFDASKDGTTEKIGIEERLINKEVILGQLIIEEIIKGPSVKSELRPILPKETRLFSFSIKNGIACVNLSKEAKVVMPKIKEKACLTSILKSLLQLPSVEKVQILIENKNVDSLGGNYDISSPFGLNEINMIKE